MTRLRADALLLMVAVIWGTAFVAQKTGNDAMSPLWFVAVRFAVSAAILAPFAVWESRKAATFDRSALKQAFAIGLCMAVGACLQQIALVTASATNGGFLTALYVVLVPFTTWLLTRGRIRPIILLASLLSVAGAYLLGAHGALVGWAVGDTLLLVSDVAWAFAISLVPLFLARARRPFFLAFLQFTMTGAIAGVAAVAFEGPLDGIAEALPSLLYAAVISGGIAYTAAIIAQGYTPAPEAALIMSLESIFAAVAGALLLGERLTMLAGVGCLLILLAVVVVELRPVTRPEARSPAR